MSFDALFYPKAVVVIGSQSAGKLGNVLLKQIIKGRYEGNLYAVNPKGQGYENVPGFQSVESIGKKVDLAIIAAPAATIPGVLDDCGKGGVGAAVVITSGFSEMGNHDGEKQVLEAARRNGIRIVGPNCAGIVCTSHKLYPTLEIHPPEGGVALISQSGALGGVVLAWAEEQGLGMSKFVSYGNGIDLNQVELLRYLKDDPETSVIALYIESIKDGREFMEALQDAASAKPVVVIKAGRTNVGQRATASHTGSMAGSDNVYEAAFKQSGAVRVNTIEEMIDLCTTFIACKSMDGDRVVIVTNSGGPGVLAADRGEEVGMDMAEVSPEMIDTLKTFLPPFCGFKNPVDLTVEGTEEGYRKTLVTLLEAYDAAIAMNICPPYLDASSHAKGVADAFDIMGKPVLANFLPNQVVADSVKYLKERGIPNFPSGERAIETLARLSDYHKRKRIIKEHGGFSEVWQKLQSKIAGQTSKLPGGERILEPEAMGWLRDLGIPVPEFRFASDEAQAIDDCESIGFPCVMKVVSPQIIHKSEFGGVIVGIKNRDEAAKSFQTIRKRAEGKDFRGVVIYPQVKGAQEVLLGLSVDPQFGPVVVFGLGGIYTELFKDISIRVAPVNHHQAMEMIRETKSVKLLQGFRGAAASDLDMLADTIVRFSEIPFLYPEIKEADLNPIFVLPDRLMVGDVRIIK